jgi:hypothetical protein
MMRRKCDYVLCLYRMVHVYVHLLLGHVAKKWT